MVYSKLGCQIRQRTSVKTNNTRRRFWKITNTNHPVLKPDVNARTVALGEISYSEGRHVKKNRTKLKGSQTICSKLATNSTNVIVFSDKFESFGQDQILKLNPYIVQTIHKHI